MKFRIAGKRPAQLVACGGRGGVYVAVLGITLFVTVIGVGALYQSQRDRSMREAIQESRRARLDARSAMEVALERIASDPNWRQTHKPGVWTSVERMGDSDWSVMLEFDAKADADDTILLTITAGASRELASRYYSATFIAPPSTSDARETVVFGSEFETTTDPWTPVLSSLEIDSSESFEGSASMLVADRLLAYTSWPIAEIWSHLEIDTEYQFSAWVRLPEDEEEEVEEEAVEASITLSRGLYLDRSRIELNVVGGVWTEISGTLSTAWSHSDLPSRADLSVWTMETNTEYHLDAVSLVLREESASRIQLEFVEGSFRQRVVE